MIYAFFPKFFFSSKGKVFNVSPKDVGWNGGPMGGSFKKKKKKEEEGENQFFGQICWEVLCASLRVIIILA